jgi:hypothetical protein
VQVNTPGEGTRRSAQVVLPCEKQGLHARSLESTSSNQPDLPIRSGTMLMLFTEMG